MSAATILDAINEGMLYNRDPLLPFQLAQKLKTDQNCSDNGNDECRNLNN